MFSVDDRGDEPWGDVPYLRPYVPARRGAWFDRAFMALTVVAGAIGAMGALRLGDGREATDAKETSRRG